VKLISKVILIVSAVFICGVGLVYTVSRFIFIRGLQDIEEQNTMTQVEQAAGVLTYLINDLETNTADWAGWDDTYRFMSDLNEDYIKSNLVDSTFTTLKLYTVLYINLSGNIVYSKAYDYENNREIAVSEELLSHFRSGSPLLVNPENDSIYAGVLEIADQPVLVSTQPILTSDKEGPSRGTLVFSRFLNEDAISELSSIVQFPISVYPISSKEPQDIQDAAEILMTGQNSFISPLNNDTVAGYSLLNDLYGKASFILKVEVPRDTYLLGQKVSSYYIFSIIGIGILIALLIWLFIQKNIISRIALLISGVNRIADTGNTSTRIALTGTDEVSVVAGTIDGMLEALEEAGKEIRSSENRYRLLADNATDVIWSTDKDLRITYVSPSVYRLTGSRPEDLIGTEITGLFDEPARDEVLTYFRSEIYKESPSADKVGSPSYEIQIKRKNESLIWVDVRVSVVNDNDGNTISFVGIARDIAERRQAEQLYRTLANSSTVGVYIYQDGLYKFVNPRFQELTGYSEEALLKMNPRDIVNREDISQARENAIRMLKGEFTSPYEFRVIHPSGEIRWAMETVSSIVYNGKRATLGNFMDITESKIARSELEKLYAEEIVLRQSLEEEIQKRVEFTRALVHELKTPITPVLAAVELLLEEVDDKRIMRLVKSIDRSAANLNQRIDELLDLARGEMDMLVLNTESIDTLAFFNELSNDMMPVALRNKQKIKFDLPDSMPMIQADKGRLRQVVTNLFSNAFKFTPEGESITLRARTDDDNLIVEVSDTGSGISEEDLKRLFQPYFRRTTDRERLSGLGLGLALSKYFIELHGGKIWVESTVGKGSIFHFTIPIEHENLEE